MANFWKSLYDQNLAPNEAYKGDSFGDQKAAMAIVGPWAIAGHDESKPPSGRISNSPSKYVTPRVANCFLS